MLFIFGFVLRISIPEISVTPCFLLNISTNYSTDGASLILASIIVCDECDDMVFNNPILFMKFVKKRAVIALTASATDNVEKGIERQVLRMMNFKIYENLIDEIYTQPQNPEFEKIECQPGP